MTPEQWRRISGIFHGALEQAPEARQKFLDDACGAERDLRAEVERLLVAHQNAGAFGEGPIYSQNRVAVVRPSRIVADPADSSSIAAGTDAAPAMRRPRTAIALLWLMLIAGAAAFAYAGWLLVLRGGTAEWFGWQAVPRDADWIVATVPPDGPAAQLLQRGDVLTSVNGLPLVADAGPFLGLRDLDVGDSYDVVVERASESRSVRLTIAGRSNAGELIWYAVSFVWCAIGLFIGLARPESVLARLACITAVAVGLVFLQVGVVHGGPLWQPLHAVLGYHFLARFPTGRPTEGIVRGALWLAYFCGGVSAAIGLLAWPALLRGTAAAVQLMTEWDWLFRLRRPFGIAGFAVALLGMVLVLPYNYRRLTDEDQRRRVRWVVYGSIVGLAPQLWWLGVSLLERTVGPTALSRFDLAVNGFTVTIPLVLAYAVVKHRVLDIKVVVRRGVQYLLARRALQALVALPFVALLYVLLGHRDLTLTELVTETSAYLFWIALAGIALRFRRPIRAWLDRRFFREEYDREQLMLKLLDESRRVETLSELSGLVSDTVIRALHPDRAFVWYRDPRERADTATGRQGPQPEFPADERWLSWLEQRGTLAKLPVPKDAGLSRDAARSFESRGIDVVVPIADSSDRLVGALLLGAKRSEEPYNAGDSRFLNAVARQTAVIRENLRLRARLSEEVRVRHDVLARLDDRLPELLKECPACGTCFSGAVESCPADGHALVLTLPIARTLEGRYRLDRVLGKGGMGAVYEAQDLRLERIVAVKVMLSRAFGQPAALRRFRREARAAARVSHPNIVTVYDVGALEAEGAYIVMERVRGETLRAALERERVLSPAVAAQWFGPLLDGIDAAHARGIVHRDLKPENVMGERQESGALAVKILDLGLVKLRADGAEQSVSMTQDGVIMGTPDYMSPEQLLGREVDQRADLFAIGVMLLEALTGRKTLLGEADARRSPPEAIDAKPLSGDLDGLVRQCLAVDASDRPESAAVLRDRLLPLLLVESSELSSGPTP
jgi:hypothetical protein